MVLKGNQNDKITCSSFAAFFGERGPLRKAPPHPGNKSWFPFKTNQEEHCQKEGTPPGHVGSMLICRNVRVEPHRLRSTGLAPARHHLATRGHPKLKESLGDPNGGVPFFGVTPKTVYVVFFFGFPLKPQTKVPSKKDTHTHKSLLGFHMDCKGTRKQKRLLLRC